MKTRDEKKDLKSKTFEIIHLKKEVIQWFSLHSYADKSQYKLMTPIL